MTSITIGIGVVLFLAALLVDLLAPGGSRYRLPLVFVLLVTGLGLVVFSLARRL